MSRFFVEPEYVKGKEIIITGKEAHHILDVMRLKCSDNVVTFDGTGKEYSGIIVEASRDSLIVKITEVRQPHSGMASPITLLQALPKKDKMDYIVEKSTELGVASIVPILTQRTIPDWDQSKKLAQAQRWQKIAKEASKQCGRADIPTVEAVSEFSDAVKKYSAYDMKLIAILNKDTIPVREVLAGFVKGKVAIAIGPEGDFTPGEFKIAVDSGFKAISLGPRVLKSDTAGLALLSILNYELTD